MGCLLQKRSKCVKCTYYSSNATLKTSFLHGCASKKEVSCCTLSLLCYFPKLETIVLGNFCVYLQVEVSHPCFEVVYNYGVILRKFLTMTKAECFINSCYFHNNSLKRISCKPKVNFKT